jgi:hypothetical protein
MTLSQAGTGGLTSKRNREARLAEQRLAEEQAQRMKVRLIILDDVDD